MTDLHNQHACCSTTPSTPAGKRLVILGGGSAAFAAATRAVELGAEQVTIINDGLPIGGTCVNVGCVPSKTLIRAAEAVHASQNNRFDGIKTTGIVSDFAAVSAQRAALVAELRQGKYLDVVAAVPEIRIIDGHGRFVGPKSITVNGETIDGDRVLIATGTRPYIPSIDGLEEAGFLTNDTAFELTELPESLVVLGGRYIALECAQMFARFGSRVTVLQRSGRILPTESPKLTDALTGYLRDEGIEVVTGVHTTSIRRENGEVLVETTLNGEPRQFRSSDLLVATGRTPNTRDLGLETIGVELTAEGYIATDETNQTSVPGVYAAGDVIGSPEFVYTAAYEGALAASNAMSPTKQERDYTALPWVIFTDPQVAGVGLDLQQATEMGIDAEATTLPMHHVPRALAARDTRGFLTLVRDRESDRLLGARVLAPEGSELLPEISLAIKHGITATQIRESFHAYLTLGEAVKLAAITFGKDVEALSCCAT